MVGVMMLNSSFGSVPPAALVYNLDATIGALPGANITNSANFNGSSQYLTLPASTNWALGTGDFTIEWWQYMSATQNATPRIFSVGTYSSASIAVSIESGTFYFWENGSFTFSSSLSSYTTTWVHFAISRVSGQTSVYQNGTKLGSTFSDTNNISDSSSTLTIGTESTPAANTYYTGYISNFRIIKGTGIYTSNFTAPTKALLPVSGTVLLLPLTTTPFVDISSYGATVTNNGTTTTTASAPSITGPTTDLTGTYTLTITNAAPSITWSTGNGGVFNKTGSNTTDLIKGGPNYTSSSQSYTVFMAYQLQPVSSSVGNGRILATADETTNDWLLGSYAPGTPNSPMYFNAFYPNADMGYNVDAYDTGWRFIWGTYNGTTGVSTKFIASSTVNNTSGPSSAYKTSSIGVGSHGFNQLRLWNRSNNFEPATGNIGFVKVYNGVCSISQIQSQWSAYHSRFGI